ncbi:lef-11 [Mamestra brassicae multiple nucleopolyhedrovirus]|uniref:Late expression factor 11 n=1 Tax=Mamestra brassicae nuclear polyhedrosis virus TaxID=78219 RepID=I3XMF7_NPVMB|nr:lef-11 [Mamestra brassicae multiple nucleopolyhedrovirus]AFL64990.1 lef-11 [Mamestra brassicae multiple nucleopolyhedrovirus]WRQ96713.1 lef-11 [Mamestra configurata nucleopolyhedrovirus B]WRQ96874.1 lef-11 [Mamestra configurata nucleopolyhedrovirus B]WRQ97035.1 lef-11 [Mamestra configurata nucleopolyhedrovirus B]
MDAPSTEGANVDYQHEPQKNSQCCLTRSEVYALVREVINKRKHHNLFTNVCDHVFDDGFEEQLKYIRANIDKALITVGGEHKHCKRLAAHIKKINKIFKLNKSLETEYKQSIDKYGSNRFNRNK